MKTSWEYKPTGAAEVDAGRVQSGSEGENRELRFC